MPAIEAIRADVGEHPAVQTGADQLVDLQPQILASGEALALLDAVKIGQRLLRQRLQGTWMKGALFHAAMLAKFANR